MRFFGALLGLTVVVLALPCAAEEIVVFKSGQTMPVISHRIEDGMVHVDLGGNAYVAFPEATIEAIEVAGENVMLKQSVGSGRNKRVPSSAGDYPVHAPTKNPGYEILAVEPGETESDIEIDGDTGMALYRPKGDSRAPNKRRFAVTGDLRAMGANKVTRGNGSTTFGGTTPLGNRHVVGGLAPRRSDAGRRPVPQVASVRLKAGKKKSSPPPPPPPRNDDEN